MSAEEFVKEMSPYQAAFAHWEFGYIVELLNEHRTVAEAAITAGLNRSSLYRKMTKYGIRKRRLSDVQ